MFPGIGFRLLAADSSATIRPVFRANYRMTAHHRPCPQQKAFALARSRRLDRRRAGHGDDVTWNLIRIGPHVTTSDDTGSPV